MRALPRTIQTFAIATLLFTLKPYYAQARANLSLETTRLTGLVETAIMDRGFGVLTRAATLTTSRGLSGFPAGTNWASTALYIREVERVKKLRPSDRESLGAMTRGLPFESLVYLGMQYRVTGIDSWMLDYTSEALQNRRALPLLRWMEARLKTKISRDMLSDREHVRGLLNRFSPAQRMNVVLELAARVPIQGKPSTSWPIHQLVAPDSPAHVAVAIILFRNFLSPLGDWKRTRTRDLFQPKANLEISREDAGDLVSYADSLYDAGMPFLKQETYSEAPNPLAQTSPKDSTAVEARLLVQWGRRGGVVLKALHEIASFAANLRHRSPN